MSLEAKRRILERITKEEMEITALKLEVSRLRESSMSLAHPYSEIGPVVGGKTGNEAMFENPVECIIDLESVYYKRMKEINEIRKKIRLCVDQLEPDEKAVIIMHYYANLTYRQIAAELHCSERSVSRLMKRALQNLNLESMS